MASLKDLGSPFEFQQDGVNTLEAARKLMCQLGVVLFYDCEFDDQLPHFELLNDLTIPEVTTVFVKKDKKDTPPVLKVKRTFDQCVRDSHPEEGVTHLEWNADFDESKYQSMDLELLHRKQDELAIVNALWFPKVVLITAPVDKFICNTIAECATRWSLMNILVVAYSGEYNWSNSPYLLTLAQVPNIRYLDVSRFVLYKNLPDNRILSASLELLSADFWNSFSHKRTAQAGQELLGTLNPVLIAPDSLFDKEKKLPDMLEVMTALNKMYQQVLDGLIPISTYVDLLRGSHVPGTDTLLSTYFKEKKAKIIADLTRGLCQDFPVADVTVAQLLWHYDTFPPSVRIAITIGHLGTMIKPMCSTITPDQSGHAAIMELVPCSSSAGQDVANHLRNIFKRFFTFNM